MAPALAYGIVFVGVVGHASSELFAVLSGVSGPEASVWRFVLGALGLLIICALWPRHRDLITPLKRHWRSLVPLSLAGVSGAYLAFHWALDFASVIQVGTLVTTIPIFVGLTNLIINGQPITTPKLITGCAAVLGVALLLTDGYLARLAGDTDALIGVLLATVCAILAAAFSVLIKPIMVEYGAIRITTVTLSIGAAGLWLIVGLFFGIWVNIATLFERSAGEAAALATLGIWNTTITQVLWLGGLAAVPDITRGSYLFFLKPTITAALAVLFLAQSISVMEGLAIVVICTAVAVELCWPQISRAWHGRDVAEPR